MDRVEVAIVEVEELEESLSVCVCVCVRCSGCWLYTPPLCCVLSQRGSQHPIFLIGIWNPVISH